jgi:AcrR family transcriptional regulator
MSVENQDRSRQRRRYHAPRRLAGAARTRAAIVSAAKTEFERLGWSGATIPTIAEGAGVSPKTVVALYGTKARLLQAAVEYAIRGDLAAVEMPQRPQITAMEATRSAAEMLDLHAKLVREVNGRSAAIARTVEDAARTEPAVAELWTRMDDNRRFGVRWAARTVATKQGFDCTLRRREVEEIFWIAIGWETYRLLTEHAALTPAAFERWLRFHYRQLLAAA